MNTLYINIKFSLHNFRKLFRSWLFRLGCYFFSAWHYIESDNICTIGSVLKLNKLYTYQENDLIDIVRLTDVHIERGFLYCSLFFFSKNQIITVRHTLMKGTKVIWRLLDNREFDERMSIRLWNEVNEEVELLEFDF